MTGTRFVSPRGHPVEAGLSTAAAWCLPKSCGMRIPSMRQRSKAPVLDSQRVGMNRRLLFPVPFNDMYAELSGQGAEYKS